MKPKARKNPKTNEADNALRETEGKKQESFKNKKEKVAGN